ncbi:YopT-type cysteine protease domain-containing protein [Ralstonia pseudosolanacearum]|uniref:YopT-type cysteine protease domain-containing protein n=1 Tax=Ralstonia pseudosolanacearum TaxID=1310165 RepID=UPI003CEEFBE4
MAQCAVARTRQGLAFRARFGAESAQHYSGSCVGLSAVWIRLHEAAVQLGMLIAEPAEAR